MFKIILIQLSLRISLKKWTVWAYGTVPERGDINYFLKVYKELNYMSNMREKKSLTLVKVIHKVI